MNISGLHKYSSRVMHFLIVIEIISFKRDYGTIFLFFPYSLHIFVFKKETTGKYCVIF